MKKRHRGRRKRRQANMVIRSKGKFKINHKSKSGRTGKIHSTHMKTLKP